MGSGGIMIEQRQLVKQGAVGGLQRDAQARQRRLIQRVAQMLGGGHRGGGDIGGAAGHPFGYRDRRVQGDADLLTQRRRVAPVGQQLVDHRPRQRPLIVARFAGLDLDGAVPVHRAGDQLLAAEDPALDKFSARGGTLCNGHVFTFPLTFARAHSGTATRRLP